MHILTSLKGNIVWTLITWSNARTKMSQQLKFYFFMRKISRDNERWGILLGFEISGEKSAL